jgi:hypothetical protein
MEPDDMLSTAFTVEFYRHAIQPYSGFGVKAFSYGYGTVHSSARTDASRVSGLGTVSVYG